MVSPLGTQQPQGDAFTDILQPWVVAITGLDAALVRPRWQPTPPVQPALDVNWCAIGIVNDAPEPGQPHIQHIGAGDGQDLMRRHRVLDGLVSFYGPAADDYAALFCDGAYVEVNNALLYDAAAALVSVDDMRIVPELWQTQWLRRVDVPFRIRRALQRQYPINNILSSAGTIVTDGGPESAFEAKE